MGQTNINIRMDEEIKKQAENLFSDLGMNMSTAFNIFVRQSLRYGGIPFEITTQTAPFYSDTNKAVLRESIASLNTGKGAVHELIEDTDDYGLV